MAVEHQVDVHVPEPRHDAHPLRGNHLGPFRHSKIALMAHGFYPLPFHDNDTIVDGLSTKSINQRTTNECFDSCILCRNVGNGKKYQEQE